MVMNMICVFSGFFLVFVWCFSFLNAVLLVFSESKWPIMTINLKEQLDGKHLTSFAFK